MIEALAAGLLTAAIDVSRVTTPYARVPLPPSIDATAAGDYHDLRVLDDRGAEVPYVIDAQLPGASPPIAPVNRRFITGTGTQAVFDLGVERSYQALTLHVDRDAYFTRVAVDAGNDPRTWRTIRDDALVYRLERNGRAESTVPFVPTTARYFRVRVLDGRAPFPLDGAAPASWDATRPTAVTAGVTTAGTRPDSRTQRFTLDLRNDHAEIAAVRLDTDTPAFARNVDVESSTDGVTWSAVASDRVERFAEGPPHLDVATGEGTGRFWRVTVHDDDDAPLEGVTVRLLSPPHDLVFPVSPGRQYALRFGDPAAARPVYDLAQRLHHEAWQADSTSLAAIVRTGPHHPAPNVLSEPPSAIPPWLVTAAFASAAVSLAGWALRLLRRPGRADRDPPP